ncbi:MAG: ECF-type sigma factor [Planctomycetota bacterium]
MEGSNETVVGWIRQFNAGDSAAAAAGLWQHYFERVAAAARRKLVDAPRRMSDEEDVASSVLRCLCNGAANGRFDDLSNHDDLWRLLMTITKQKCVDQIRRDSLKKRGDGRVRGESVLSTDDDRGPHSLDDFIGEEPTPEYLAQLDEQLALLLKTLPDQMTRELVERRLEGWSNEEIAQQLSISIHAVRRKLRLVRTLWLQQIAH